MSCPHKSAILRALIWALLGVLLTQPPGSAQPPREAAKPREKPADPAKTARQQTRPAPTSPAPPAEWPADAPVFLFLSPTSFDALLSRLKRPDFVLQQGERYQHLQERADAATAPATRRTGVVESVAVRGRVYHEQAQLTIDFGVTASGSEPVWVPLRLNGQILKRAHEGTNDLALQATPTGEWQVEVRGPGRHTVEVELIVPVTPTTLGQKLALEIPEAASTEIQLDIPQRVVEAISGAKDLAPELTTIGPGTRLSAHLPPKSLLDLTWRVESQPGILLPPLLSARGEIRLEVDPSSLFTRSTWDVRSERGTARSLELECDPADEVLTLELDGQAVPTTIRVERGHARILVPLAQPLRPGGALRMELTTRRLLATRGEDSPPVHFHGFPLANAALQSGVLILRQEEGLLLATTPGPGLRPVDPWRELAPERRGRAGNLLAYRFAQQPFDFELRVDRSSPWVRVEASTTLTVESGSARVDTWLTYQVTRGQLFDLRIGLPRGLDLEAVGPENVVGASQWSPEDPGPAPPDLTKVPRILKVQLTPHAAKSAQFRIHLTGRQAVTSGDLVPVALFQPRDVSLAVVRMAVVRGARNVAVDLAEGDGATAAGRWTPAGAVPPEDWPWPAERSPVDDSPPLWLRCDGEPPAIPLRVVVQPRQVDQETVIKAQVERNRLDVRQETTCRVRYGSLNRLEIAVPPHLDGLWEIEGVEVAGRGPRKAGRDGNDHYLLTLSREVTESLRLRFHYRIALHPGLAPSPPTTLEVPWIRVLEGTSAAPRLQVLADMGIDLTVRARGWVTTGLDGVPAAEGGLPVRWSLIRTEEGAAPVELVATARALAPLPPVVASRLWLRTVQGPGSDLRVTAWFWLEAHGADLSVRLPDASRWERAWVAGEPVGEVEWLSAVGPAAYRLRFPASTTSAAVSVGLEYQVPAEAMREAWQPPQLLDGGVVQQTLWEVSIPWNRAVVGVPPGWTDENLWYWDRYVFKRRPWPPADGLATWAAGPATRARVLAEAWKDDRANYHSYLFGRFGTPTDLPLRIVSRAALVGWCSGGVLVAGLLILFLRPRLWLVGLAALGLVLAIASLIEPSTVILVAQSSVIGLALSLVAALIHRLERRRSRSPLFLESGGSSSVPSAVASYPDSDFSSPDASTAIRFRPPTTVDRHPPVPSHANAPQGSGLGQELGP